MNEGKENVDSENEGVPADTIEDQEGKCLLKIRKESVQVKSL
jgi:hypothetical protein